MAIRVTLECGHASMLRVRTTPEGYTHDWEVFVRGVDNADISQYVDRVVFNLHETFQKPKRILKEPPYIVKESGYAGFEIPIDVYLKNKDEPKKFQIQYDLHLQTSGPTINNVIQHHEIFVNPSEEFRKKLLKGGGVAVPHLEDSTEKGEFKMVPPMVSKPKLSGTDVKKHRMTEVRSSNEFSDLFGNIMTLPAKVSPDNKRSLSDKIISSKSCLDKIERTEKPVKKHSPHKEKKKDKNSDERKDKKERIVTKDKDRVKDKSKRPQSPVIKEDTSNQSVKKNSSPSPTKKHIVSSVLTSTQKPPSPKPKDKQHKKISADKEKDRVKDNFKMPIEERIFDRKKKKHKEDKSKDRKDKEKEKDYDKVKDSSKVSDKKIPKPEKHEKSDKDKNSDIKISKDGKKSPKYPKDRDKSIRSDKSSRVETLEKVNKDSHTDRERQKHKHKKKDKKDKIDELTDRTDKQEKHKITSEKKNCYGTLSSSSSSGNNPLSTLLAEMPERDSSDSPHSVDDESLPVTKSSLMPVSESEIVTNPILSSNTESKTLSPRRALDSKNDDERVEERCKKDKTKSARSEERESRKRKRKDNATDDHIVKREKDRGPSLSPSVEPVSSSQSPISIEINSPYTVKEIQTPSQPEIHNQNDNEQVAPDSTNNTFIEPEVENPLDFSDDYVSQLKELQQKIMTLQDNQELQRVVQVIAETGQYEITRKTFDFDLCALDRTTVQRLQEFFSAS